MITEGIRRSTVFLGLCAAFAACQLPPASTKGGTGKIDAGTGTDVGSVPGAVIPTYEAETMTAIDPRPGSQLAYAATIESIVADAPGSVTGKCIIRKQIHVYRSTDLGKTWHDMPGTAFLPHGADDWATDPDLSVGGDGTLYLTLLLGHATPNCQTPQDLSARNIQLWFAPPPNGEDDPGLQPAFPDGLADISNTAGTSDHPQIVASPTVPGLVVVSVANRSFLVTFRRDESGTYFEVGSRVGTDGFVNMAMDESGQLYIAYSIFQGSVGVRRFTFSESSEPWVEGTPAMPPPVARDHGAVGPFGINAAATPAVRFEPEATPALAVATLPGATTPTVFVGFMVAQSLPTGSRFEIQVSASSDLTNWSSRLAPPPPGTPWMIHPSLSVDARNGHLDLLAQGLVQTLPAPGTPPPPLSDIRLQATFVRYRTNDLTICAGPTSVNKGTANMPRLSDIPIRHAMGSEEGQDNSLFIGEYVGIASKDNTAVVSWSEFNTSTSDVDVGLAALTTACDTGICPGSGLTNDPSARAICTPPPPPIPGCGPSTTSVDVTRAALPPVPSTFDVSAVTAADPRPDSGIVYSATVESATQASIGPTGRCITGRRIRVYRSADFGSTWAPLAGNDNLPQLQWATDPDMTVAADGTLYLTFMRTRGSTDCNSDPDFSLADIQVWFARPPQLGSDPGLTPALAAGASPFGDGAPAVSGTTPFASHPQIASSAGLPNRIVVAVEGFIATFDKGSSGSLTEINRRTAPSGVGAVEMDRRGDLYLAMFNVERFSWSEAGGWTLITSGGPPGNTTGSGLEIPSSPSVAIIGGAAPGLAVTTLGNTSTPIVFVAQEVFDAQGALHVQLAAANSDDLKSWTTRMIASPAGSLSTTNANLSVDGQSNSLDLVVQDVMGTAGASLADMRLQTTFYRFDASRLALFAGPTVVNAASPTLADIPSNDSAATEEGEGAVFDHRRVLYAGTSLGVSSKGLAAFVGWPELQAPGNVDLGLATVVLTCMAELTLIDPDAAWRCTCNCGSGGNGSVGVVGCADSDAALPGAACAQVCAGSPCGQSLTCTATACASTGVGTRLSAGTCATADRRAGAPPAALADYTATATGASSMVVRLAGQSATTTTTGQAFLNVTTSPPTTGAGLEIALLDAHPADVFLGGSVNATLRNIALLHRSRLQGVFTDAKHFRLDPGNVELVVTLQADSGGVLSAPINFLGTNPTAMTGTFDLATNTFSLDGVATDTAGNALELHFRSTITVRPPDSNHDGIIDAVDKCPGVTVGPDRIPPKFTFVPPAITITKCSAASIGQATATDPCGVTITNNAPAKYPLGTTTVVWKAVDKAGNVATAAQAVTAVLGNDSSCCPSGTHVVLGTSNNDVLTGTSGSDCILGLGGQDRITGGGGNDFISGGDGDDTITGDDGNDRLYGGTGQDVISGGNGNDFIDGGDGVDQLNGDAGDDTIVGGQGTDRIFGGIGNDTLIGGADDDFLFGGDGADRLIGGAGNDQLKGENGNDSLFGSEGDDILDGGSGLDVFDGGSGHNQCIENAAVLACQSPRR